MKYAGQNIFFQASTGGGATFEDPSEFIEQAIRVWYNEKQFASQANIDNCCGGENIPHFMELSVDKVNQVGCAISQYTDSQGKKSYIACNYSFTIIEGQKTYHSGPSGSDCVTGTNPNYPALCSENEQIDPNDPFAI